MPVAIENRQARPNATSIMNKGSFKKPKILSAVEQLKNRYAVLEATSSNNKVFFYNKLKML